MAKIIRIDLHNHIHALTFKSSNPGIVWCNTVDPVSKNLFSVKQSDSQGLKGQNHERLYLLTYLSSKTEENISLHLAAVVYSNSTLQQQDALV